MKIPSSSPKSVVPLKPVYIFLSLLTGFFELGCIVVLISLRTSAIQVLIAGLAYQLGNLTASTIRLSKKSIMLILSASTALICLYQYDKNFLFYSLSVLLVSIGIQKTRRLLLETIGQDGVSVFSKRTVRIIGFLLAGAASGITLTIGVVVTLVVTILALVNIRIESLNAVYPKKAKGNRLAAIMVIHQSHYFSYALWIPLILTYRSGVPIYLIGVCFIIGWLSYIYSERLFGRFNIFWVFIAGHILVAISLIVIGTNIGNLILVLLAWFVSGLGGGSVFSLKRLNKTISSVPIDLDLWEDVGHVSGVLVSIILTLLLTERFYNPFYVSAAIALLAALAMFLSRSRMIPAKPRFDHKAALEISRGSCVVRTGDTEKPSVEAHEPTVLALSLTVMEPGCHKERPA